MKITAAMANKYVKELQEKIVLLYKVQERDKTYVSIPNMEDVIPDYNFSEVQESLEELESHICRIKHSVNVFNTTTTLDLPGKPTIDEVLVKMAQLNKRLQILDNMRTISAKKLEDTSGFGRQGVQQYRVATFNPADASAEYQKIYDEVKNMQMQLDLVNNTVTFECEGF